jgi:hypothetical protein
MLIRFRCPPRRLKAEADGAEFDKLFSDLVFVRLILTDIPNVAPTLFVELLIAIWRFMILVLSHFPRELWDDTSMALLDSCINVKISSADCPNIAIQRGCNL